MSNEFWIGFFYGVIAAAIPLCGYIAWDANRRVQRHLREPVPGSGEYFDKLFYDNLNARRRARSVVTEVAHAPK